MSDMDALQIGMTGTATLVVGSNDTALRVGSGSSAVLATPVMITLAEEAALDAVESYLAAGKQTLGTLVNISHIAATPIGMTVVARATLSKIDGRMLEFAIHVSDEQEVIGEGQHNRVVVSTDRFQKRIDEKANR